ncbi:MAG: 30S ribosome-binding factor RbfA [Lachnospiraceae bacterium]|nr:30S ribosome-binding factor RbfA [Lachnospiraceae bacterium]
MRKNSVKNTRVNSEVMKVLAEIIRELKDPRVGMLTSVVDVQISPDLKTGKVWISSYGDAEEQARCLEGIKSAEGFIRNRLAKELNLRNTPQLTFIMDDSIAYGVSMSKKIREVIGEDD